MGLRPWVTTDCLPIENQLNKEKTMKAYVLEMKDDSDAGCEIVFANTAKEAKKQAIGKDFYEMSGEWLELRVRRYKHFDGMEKLSNAELAKEQWREGWWFHESGYPDPDETTDEQFIEWHNSKFDR